MPSLATRWHSRTVGGWLAIYLSSVFVLFLLSYSLGAVSPFLLGATVGFLGLLYIVLDVHGWMRPVPVVVTLAGYVLVGLVLSSFLPRLGLQLTGMPRVEVVVLWPGYVFMYLLVVADWRL